MRLKKEFKRLDGTWVEVNVSFGSSSLEDTGYWDYSFLIKEKGNRKYIKAPYGFNADKEINNALDELLMNMKPPVCLTPDF